MAETELTVAITGPTGTFGFGLVPRLQDDDRVARILGIARRPFDPAAHGWSKMSYRRGDVRDADALEGAFTGADVVVHLAFIIVGGKRETAQAINVEGTINAFRAAVAVGARRFVFASSVAAYGFHRDNPDPITEDWPTRPATRLFYAQEKAELEGYLRDEAAKHPELELYVVRPCVVVGPQTVGGKDLPGPVAALFDRVPAGLRRLPAPVPVPVPDMTMQLVHQDDVGQALQLCVVGAGPPGAYNLAGDGVLRATDIARELGFLPIPLPPRPVQAAARAVARLPLLPAPVEWVEVLAHPPIMDTTRARTLLGWSPRCTGLEALRDALAAR